MRGNGISGLPVVDAKPVGILTNRDIRFAKELDQPVRTHMTTDLITAPEGISLTEAKSLLHRNR